MILLPFDCDLKLAAADDGLDNPDGLPRLVQDRALFDMGFQESAEDRRIKWL